MNSPSLDRLLPGILASALIAAAPAAQERTPAPSVGGTQRVAQEQVRTTDERPAPAERRTEKARGLPEVSDLAGVRGAFADTDGDKNGTLNLAEATGSGISRPMFQAFDIDSSGGIDRDEFTVSYRQLLADTRRPVHRDLDSEAARLRALNKQRHEEARKRRTQDGRPHIVPAPEGPAVTSDAAQERARNARLETVAEKAEHDAAARQANQAAEARRANRQAEHAATARKANQEAGHAATARRANRQAEHAATARKANQEAEHAATARRANRQAEHDAAARKANQEAEHVGTARRANRQAENAAAARKANQEAEHAGTARRAREERTRQASRRGKDAGSNDAAHKAHQERIRNARRDQYGGQNRGTGSTGRTGAQRGQDRPAPRGSQGHKPEPRKKQQPRSQRP